MSPPIIPLAKPDGGVRPIAVGGVWRRLTSKVALGAISCSTRDFLLPFQLGVGIKRAAEGISHSLNQLVAKHSSVEGMGVLKVDLTNAFNLVSRVAFFEGVRQHFPSLSSRVEYCYGCQAQLFIWESTILSCCGVQQGDPLGPLLFAITLQPLVCRIGDACPGLLLNSWYVDDGVLMGRREDLVVALKIIQGFEILHEKIVDF